MGEESGSKLLDEIESAIREAAAGQKVVVMRLAVGKDVTVPKVEIAREMHRRFPSSSIELEPAEESDSVVVKEIEVEY